MEELSKAIISKYKANADLVSALKGKLWDTVAPNHAKYPLATFQHLSSFDRPTFSDTVESYTYQFMVYSDDDGSPAEVNSLYQLILDTFHRQTLSVTGRTFIAMEKINDYKTKLDGIWEYMIMFRIMLEKSN